MGLFISQKLSLRISLWKLSVVVFSNAHEVPAYGALQCLGRHLARPW